MREEREKEGWKRDERENEGGMIMERDECGKKRKREG